MPKACPLDLLSEESFASCTSYWMSQCNGSLLPHQLCTWRISCTLHRARPAGRRYRVCIHTWCCLFWCILQPRSDLCGTGCTADTDPCLWGVRHTCRPHMERKCPSPGHCYTFVSHKCQLHSSCSRSRCEGIPGSPRSSAVLLCGSGGLLQTQAPPLHDPHESKQR